jgi:hypothetical protein
MSNIPFFSSSIEYDRIRHAFAIEILEYDLRILDIPICLIVIRNSNIRGLICSGHS